MAEKKEKAKAKTEAAKPAKPAKPAKAAASKPAVTSKPAAKTAPAKKTAAKKTAPKKVEKVEEDKVYHISKRKADHMWQVKAEGASKSLKKFFTQAEAVEYAKTVAGNNEGRIVIHKEDGSFRKLSY